jgi:hypothetical protein
MIVKDTIASNGGGVNVVRGAIPGADKRESGALIHKINRASAKMAGKQSQ